MKERYCQYHSEDCYERLKTSGRWRVERIRKSGKTLGRPLTADIEKVRMLREQGLSLSAIEESAKTECIRLLIPKIYYVWEQIMFEKHGLLFLLS